jgi:hypothetical protein
VEKIALNKKSPAYMKARAAGFIFGEPRLNLNDYGTTLQIDFKCVCGRNEVFQRQIAKTDIVWLIANDDLFKDGWDAAQEIENFGSFSEDHLRADGFSEDAIKQIRYIYDLEDEVKRLRVIERHYHFVSGSHDHYRQAIQERRIS